MALLAFVLLLYIVFFSFLFGSGVHHGFAFLISTGLFFIYIMRVFLCSLLFCRFDNGLWVLGLDLEDCYDAMESMVLVRVDSSKQSMHSITTFEFLSVKI